MKRATRWLIRIAAGLAASAAVVWGVDELSFVLNIPSRPQYGSVHVEHYEAVTEKFNLTSYDRLSPEDQRCANALLPHGSSLPCWYVKRHPVQTQHIN